MNYYKRWIGDYGRKTGHLTLIQHGAYALLLDAFYASGKPLPADEPTLFRLLRAIEPEEQDAIRKVLDQFWKITGEGWINARALEEIQKATRYSAEQRQRAEKRWAKPEEDAGAHALADASADANAVPDAMPDGYRIDASHSHSHSHSHSQKPEPTPGHSLSTAPLDFPQVAIAQAEIYSHWTGLAPPLTRHRTISRSMADAIADKLNGGNYSVDDCKAAITRYAELVALKRGPGHNAWGLLEFLTAGDGVWFDKHVTPGYQGIPEAPESPEEGQ